MLEIITDYEPKDNEIKIIRNGILTFNADFTGDSPKHMALYLKDEHKKTFGGLIARLHAESIYIDILWLDKTIRLHGYGEKLLHAAEDEARKHGCQYSTLDTYTFQAVDFYLKNGYERLGEIKNYFHNYTKVFLRKVL